jgi:5-formyltetrahydrofolate cyclo-ligase
MPPSSRNADKSRLRNKLRLILKAMRASERRRRSRKILKRLLATSVFKKSKNIMTYISLPEEVQIRELIPRALRLGKNLFVPYIHKRRKQIQIYQLKKGLAELRKGSYGILEPQPSKARRGKASEIDLVLVPGLAFDRRGRRLGRGGGYFDRFLAKMKRAQKIGLAFREQMIKKVPASPHDIHMNKVITD